MRSRLVLTALIGLAATTTPVWGQTTTLSVNGTPPTSNNGQVITVENGTVMSVLIEDPDAAFGRYGLFGASTDNGNATGWWLGDGVTDPYPVVTGISTDQIDAQLFSSGIDIDFTPSRPGSPQVTLNGRGRANLKFHIPNGFVGTVKLQAAALEPGLTAARFSAGVELNFVNPTRHARLLVAHDSVAGNADALEFGVLEFTGDPATGGGYVASSLTNIDVMPINMAGMQVWHPHNSGGNNRPDDINVYLGDRPGVRFDNVRFQSVSLPPTAGADGEFGTADDLPARELLRCFDNATNEGFWVVVNGGPNPNTGDDFYELVGSRLSDDATGNPWLGRVAINRDGTRMLAVARPVSAGGSDDFYLVALDGSQPYLDGGSNPTDAVLVSPGAPAERFALSGAAVLTSENVFFALDNPSADLDTDGIHHRLFTASTIDQRPSATEVLLPVTGNGTTPDVISVNSFLVSEDESLFVLLAGDVSNSAPVPNLQDADWYRIRDTSPDSANNFTQFGTVSADGTFPEFFEPGDGYNGQTGFAALTRDGSQLGFVARHHDENGADDDDEVYFVATNGTEINQLSNPITLNANFDSVTNAAFNNAQDLFAADADLLYFFYGSNGTGHAGSRSMDLYRYQVSTDRVTNVTATGDVTVPFDTEGTVYPEGYFPSPSGEFLYFARGDAATTDTANLVGIELEAGVPFDITGTEFGGASSESTENDGPFGNNFSWQLRFAGGDMGALVYFAAAPTGDTNQQLWAFDADFPFAAFRLTSLALGGTTVESLAPAPDLPAVAWASGSASTATDVFYFHLGMGFVDDVTESVGTARLALGAIRFVPAAESGGVGGGAGQPGLVYATGTVGTVDNPTDALFRHVLIDGTTDQTGDVIVDQNAILTGDILHVFFAGH